MADFITIIPESTFRDTQRLLDQVNAISDAVGRLNQQARQVQFPSEAQEVIQQTNRQVRQTNRLIFDAELLARRQQSAIRNLTAARSQENRTIQEQRVQAVQLNRQQREQAILTSNLTGAYQRLNLRRTQAATRLRDLVVSENASNAEIVRAQREFDRLDRRIRSADAAVRDSTRNVGNYRSALSGVVGVTRQLVGAFGLIEAGRFLINFTRDSIALAREARGVEFAFNRIANSAQILERTREATRGLISDLEIQRAAVQLNNFNLSVEDLDTLLQLATIRATQTGQGFERLVEQIVLGLGRESTARLDDLGVSQRRINEEVDRGSSFVQAFVNIARQEIPRAGDVLDEAANSAQTFNAAVENLQVAFGELFQGGGAFSFLTGVINRTANAFRLLNVVFRGFQLAFERLSRDFPIVAQGLRDFVRLLTTPAITFFAGGLIRVSAILAGLSAAVRVVVDDFRQLGQAIRLLTINPISGANNFAQVLNSLGQTATNAAAAFRGVYISTLDDLTDQTQAAVEQTRNLQEPIQTLRQSLQELEGISFGFADEEQNQRLRELLDTFREALGVTEEFGITIDDSFATVSENTARAREQLQELREEMQDLRNSINDVITQPVTDFFGELGLSAIENLFNIEEQILELENALQVLRDSGEDVTQIIGARFAVTFNAIAEAAQQAFNFIDQFAQARFEAQLQRLQQERDIAIMFAGDNVAAQEAINEQFEAQQRQLQREQAERDKRNALFNIAINTAQGVVAALASVPPNVPLSITIGAIGALQAALVSATPIPEFKHGVRDFAGGYAVVGDGGVQEVIRTPDNNVFMTPAKSTVIDLPKGTDVYSNLDEFIRETNLAIMGGFTERAEQRSQSVNANSITANEFDKIMSKHMSNNKSVNITMDKEGFATWIGSQYTKRNLLNNRVRFKGNTNG